MENIFLIMIVSGGFIFFSMGLCVANSIEARDSKTASNIMTIFLIIGLASLIIGIIGQLIKSIFI